MDYVIHAKCKFGNRTICLSVFITQNLSISTIMIFCELYAVSTPHDI